MSRPSLRTFPEPAGQRLDAAERLLKEASEQDGALLQRAQVEAEIAIGGALVGILFELRGIRSAIEKSRS